MKFVVTWAVSLTVLGCIFAFQGIKSEEIFPGYKLQHWRFRDHVLAFPHSPSAVHSLASAQQKLRAGKPRKGFASLTLPSSLAKTYVKPRTGKVLEEVNRLVDKASAASTSRQSHYPKIKPRKGGPPHYPPINRKALYATGLIYLRDFRPGSPLYK